MVSRIATACLCGAYPAIKYDEPLFTVICPKCYTKENPEKSWQIGYGKTESEAVDVWEGVMKNKRALLPKD